MKKIFVVILALLNLLLISCNKDSITNNSYDLMENNLKPIITDVDLSSKFKGIKGGAVFYNSTKNTYEIYNSEICQNQVAPFSTFKIISTLMGLEKNIVNSTESRMGYDGQIYWREEWNKDLSLKEAFQESCVWFYEKIVDKLDKEYVQEVLDSLSYGNCDISAWNTNGHNTFWISSSLKISPLEQVEVLKKIFSEKTMFSDENINLLKELMLVEGNDEYKIYGKTGSRLEINSWFTGFFEKQGEKIYFSVILDDETQEVSGKIAKEIAIDIIRSY